MSIGYACGGYFLTAGNGESGLGNREPSASSRQPEAGSLHYALAHPCPRVGGERLYTLLRPTACQGGEGHAVARGDCRTHAGSRKPPAVSRKSALRPCAPLLVRGERATQWRGGIAEGTPEAGSQQPKAGSR